MIYVVDDAMDYRFLVQQVFKRFLPQYTLRLFSDGLELIDAIEQSVDSSPTNLTGTELARPGLLVLDVDMPKLSGFQTLEQLKQYPLWQSVPVVMMSSRVGSKFSEAAYQLGANSYIYKPMDLTELQDVMTRLCHTWLDAQAEPPSLQHQ